MRYDWRRQLELEAFSKPYYEEIDRRFFSDARASLPWKAIPFDTLIDFESLADKRVLEIGVGSGSHAQLLAARVGGYVGIDLTEHAVAATSKRLALFGLPGEVLRMDAEELAFADASFDFVWSWGVIHHSSNTRRIVDEIHRVLRPGGKAVLMVYHRGWWNYYAWGTLVGLTRGDLMRTRSLHKAVQCATDGALARYYTPASWRRLIGDSFVVDYVLIQGNRAMLFPLPSGRVKSAVMNVVPDAVTRALTGPCRMGNFLISGLTKPAHRG
jgi:SAM-dependent methyltransferase